MSETEINKSTLRSQRHRAFSTGAIYDRAYARASRRVVSLFQHEHPDEWAALLAAELTQLQPAPSPDA